MRIEGNAEGEPEVTRNFVAAARAAGTVRHLVISTALGAGTYAALPEGDPIRPFIASKWFSEEAVRSSGIAHWTILRPPALFQNYLHPQCAFHFPKLKAERSLASGIDPAFRYPHIDAADIGRFAAAAFYDPARFDRQEITPAVALLNTLDVAAAFKRATGVELPTPC